MILLETKFLPLSLDKCAIRRERLLKLLGQSGDFRFIGIVAPAGFGKSTLARQWLDEQTVQKAWLTLDRNDSHPLTFWRYLLEVCKRSGLEVPSSTAHLFNTPEENSPTVLVSTLINALTTQNHQLALVLDDFQHIQDSSILEGIAYLIDFAPSDFTLLITSRNEPSLPFARWKVKRFAKTLYSADLVFRQEEIRTLFQGSQNLEFSDDETKRVMETTGGWAAAIQLLRQETSTLMATDKDLAQLEHALKLTRDDIEDYVAYEVLEDLPQNLKDFILEVAPAYRFDVKLANHLCNISISHELISQLEARNLFLIRLDDAGLWFRFHEMLREGALHYLRETLPVKLTNTVKRLVDYYLKSHLYIEAIDLITEFADWELLKSTLEQIGNSLLKKGYHLNIINALQQAPVTLIQDSPKLQIIRLWCLFYNNQFSELTNALKQFKEGGSASALAPDLMVELSLLESYLARFQKNIDQAREITLQVLASLDRSNVPVKSLAYFGLANDYFSIGKFAEAEKALADAITQGKLEQRFSTVKSSLGLLLWILQMRGEFIQGLNLYRQTDQWIKHFHVNDPDPNTISCWLNSALVMIHCELNQLEHAASYLHPMQELLPQAEPLQKMLVHYVEGEYFSCLNKYDQAMNSFDQAALTFEQNQRDLALFSLPVQEGKAMACLQAGDYQKARVLLEPANSTEKENSLQEAPAPDAKGNTKASSSHPPTDKPVSYARLRHLEAYTTLLTLTRNNEEGLQQARHLISSARTIRAYRSEATGELFTALNLFQLNQKEEALTALLAAFSLGEQNDFTRMFLGYPEAITPWIDWLAEQGIAQPYLDKLAGSAPREDRSEDHAGNQPYSPAQRPEVEPGVTTTSESTSQAVQELQEPLSKRELEVLELIHQGLANKAIASTLHLAPATIKAHIRNIYGKLDASSRTEALAKARKSGIIQSN